jgi:hypothetical protein
MCHISIKSKAGEDSAQGRRQTADGRQVRKIPKHKLQIPSLHQKPMIK